MNSYKVSLHRDYIVSIAANSEDEARQLAEFFIAGEKDESTDKERTQYNFKINEIEMVTNDAFEVGEEIINGNEDIHLKKNNVNNQTI